MDGLMDVDGRMGRPDAGKEGRTDKQTEGEREKREGSEGGDGMDTTVGRHLVTVRRVLVPRHRAQVAHDQQQVGPHVGWQPALLV